MRILWLLALFFQDFRWLPAAHPRQLWPASVVGKGPVTDEATEHQDGEQGLEGDKDPKYIGGKPAKHIHCGFKHISEGRPAPSGLCLIPLVLV